MAAESSRIIIASDGDVVAARQTGREVAALSGFKGSDLTLIALAISEIARNIVSYAGRGEVDISSIQANGRRGILIVAQDAGPGIPDLDKAMQDGYSTQKSLGLGLPGAKRVMDDFEITSKVGIGTTVKMRKWLQ